MIHFSDGRVRGNERQKAIDRFETEDDSFIFMLSTRAGGVGINLTAADICIIFDSDWNPQNDVQAQARCHRIGQTKSVMIYRLITSRSFEQEMFDRASKKLGLEQAVLGTFDKGDDGKPTAKEMEQLLKKGAYALLEDDDETAQDFVTDDIESILKKRTRTRVVEGTKTASWLNKQGMVTKSKFTADSKSASLDMDDPNFWEKVMPDFVTPSIMTSKLDELERETLNIKKKGGRGRGKKKKDDNEEKVVDSNIDDEKKGDDGDNAAENDAENKDNVTLSRTNQKKIGKYIQDLKGMMDGVFEDIEDDNFPDEEKAICEKLLLTISCKEKLFSESQRALAKNMLKRLEGDRRRKCRVAGDEPGRFSKSKRFSSEPSSPAINEQLLIRSSKKRKKKRSRMSVEGDENKINKNDDITFDDDLDDASDVDGGFSDQDENLDSKEKSKKKAGISKKEARRRRAWASGKDLTADAGLAWPSFPHEKLPSVLKLLLEKVIKNDQGKGGIFSEPVPKDEFPEYYDMIDKPMDYGTMKEKLERGEYRSARAMQRDFRLIMSNCLRFNSPNSDIVQEAKRQVLERPNLLKESAMENHLFIAETGDVIEVYSDGEGEAAQSEKKIPKKRGRKPKNPQSSEKDKKKSNSLSDEKPRRGRPPKKKKTERDEEIDSSNGKSKENGENINTPSSDAKKKPRLKLSLSLKSENSSGEPRIPKKRKKTEPIELENDKQLSDGEIDEESNNDEHKNKRRRGESNGDNDYQGAGSVHIDTSNLKKQMAQLKGDFKASLSHFSSLGPWKMPEDIPKSKFEEIAKETIAEMGR